MGLVDMPVKGGVGVWEDGEGHLLTGPMEAIGKALLFCPLKRIARRFYDLVRGESPQVRLAMENYEENAVRKPLVGRARARAIVSYSRGVLGAGANVRGLRVLIVDTNAFRSVSGFNPEGIDPMAFAEARAQDRIALMFQNIGRLIRGDKGLTVVLILIGMDEDMRKAVRDSELIRSGSELPPVFVSRSDPEVIAAEATNWLVSGGPDEWPELTKETPPEPMKRRPKRTADEIRALAEFAAKEGVVWRDFSKKHNLNRTLTPDELNAIKIAFNSHSA
jgi:hypothetical protein